jgi:peptide deformylase
LGLDAQIVLHEIDHLEGVLFVDHLLKQKKPLYEYIDGEFEEVDLII